MSLNNPDEKLMFLEETVAREILDLNPNGDQDDAITERQFQVILKGFNHLYQPENNFLYLADEVGLGKTYLALGIMSLFRHFSANPERHCDLVLVPKKNLQQKWQKEIHQFVRQNYKLQDSLVKSVLSSPVGRCGKRELHDRMECLETQIPTYQIFRNSSFSQALNRDHHHTDEAWRSFIESRTLLFNGVTIKGHSLENLFRRSVQIFKTKDDWIQLTRCYAYLLNAALPEINLLVIDEAHNFKGGYADNDTLRNNAVARFLGLRPQGHNHTDDKEIFEAFPELHDLVRPVAQKVLFLSATPLDKNLNDMKRQLDCFLPQHSFPTVLDKSEQLQHQSYLRSVLIRGLMEIKVGGQTHSRNMYRHEHRNGNVSKTDETPQKIEKDLDALIMGVMQYKTIRHLNQKNNASFELGMLAGFESFAASNKEKVFEDASVKNNEAVDENIIRNLVSSYQQKFNQTIPHAKQDSLVKELVARMMRGEKSLVFVRRVASTNELESKIADLYACHIHERLTDSGFKKQYRSARLDLLLQGFEQRKRKEDIDKTLTAIAKRIEYYDRKDSMLLLKKAESSSPINDEDSESMKDWLVRVVFEIYHSAEEDERLSRFRELTSRHLHRERMDAEYRELAKQLVLAHIEPESDDADFDELEEDTDSDAYFYSEFFLRNPEGRRFRKRMYDHSWFDLNFYLINEKYNLVRVDRARLKAAPTLPENASKESQKTTFYQQCVRDAIKAGRDVSGPVDAVYSSGTFLTQFLFENCPGEFETWLKNVRDLFRENSESGLLQIDILNDLLKGVFRNGPGLLPTFIVEACHRKGDDFSSSMNRMIPEYFPELLTEVKLILQDFDMICVKNLPKRCSVGNLLRNLEPVVAISGQSRRSVSRTAAQFRMPGWPFVLITTDILKEGEDLHLYCKDIFHYGVAWKASDMDQRNGRVDRIGSMSYREIKKSDHIDRDNMIHIFVPYLSDTLEVNQVSRVFKGIDQFVHTFYDFTQVTRQKSSVTTGGIVSMIPAQIQERLHSKYDHGYFKSSGQAGRPLALRDAVGPTSNEVLVLLQQIATALCGQHEYFYEPKLDKANFRIVGDLVINHTSGSCRRGPFTIMVVRGEKLGVYNLRIISPICEVRGTKKEEIEIIEEKLLSYGFSIDSFMGYYSAVDVCELKIAQEDLSQRFKKIVHFADDIEYGMRGEDLQVS